VREAKDAAKRTRFYYPTDEALLSFFRSCADRHMADLTGSVGDLSALVLKGPNFVQVEAEAAAVFPNAIRIICFRDPRDIAASFLRIIKGAAGRRSGQVPAAGRAFHRQEDPRVLWSTHAVGGPPKRAIRVYYEHVVSKPRETLETLARATGLVLSSDGIDNPVWLEADARREGAWISELEGQGPYPASVGPYRPVLRPSEGSLIEQICSPLLGGYERSTTRVLPPEWSPISLARRVMERLRRS
jgi:Sulfotransferase family